MKFKVIGLNVIYYIDAVTYGHNCNFEEKLEEFPRYELLLKGYENLELHHFKLTLCFISGECGSGWTTAQWGEGFLENLCFISGECGSGWTTAQWGEGFLEKMIGPEPFAYRPKKELIIELEDVTPDNALHTGGISINDIHDEVFDLEYDGGDSYYPMGYVSVNMDLFEKTPRAHDKRLVWIFKGDSALGKSWLAHKINADNGVYETDSSEALPDAMAHSIIVLGNKYKFSIEDIKSRLIDDPEVIIVDFSKEITDETDAE